MAVRTKPAIPASAVAGVMTNPAASNLDMNNKSINNVKDTSLGFKGGGSLTRANYLDSISKKHAQNTDISLLGGHFIPTPMPKYGTSLGSAAPQQSDINHVSDSTFYVAYINWDIKPAFVKTVDSGASWEGKVVIHDLVAQDTIRLEIIDTNNVLTIFGKDNDKLYFKKSIDAGVNWIGLKEITSNVHVRCADICSIDGTTIYIFYISAVDDYLYFKKSTNGGTSWSSPVKVYTIAYTSPETVRCEILGADLIYVTISDAGSLHFHKTLNGGTSWTKVDIDTEGTYGQSDLSVVDVDNMVVIYADSSGGNDLFISVTEDGGVTWTRRGFMIGTGEGDVAIWAYTKEIFFAIGRAVASTGRVYYSADAGQNWVKMRAEFMEYVGHSTFSAIAGNSLTDFIILSHQTNTFYVFRRDELRVALGNPSNTYSIPLGGLLDAYWKQHQKDNDDALDKNGTYEVTAASIKSTINKFSGSWEGWFDDGTNFRVNIADGLVMSVEGSEEGGYEED